MDILQQLKTANDRKYSKGLEEAAFGTSGPREILDIITIRIVDELGSKPTSLKFFAASAALVYGFILGDGQEVVLKVFPADWSKVNLDISRNIQTNLLKGDYPITKPLSNVFVLGQTHATLDEYREGPPEPEVISRDHLEKLATSLAELANLCSDLKTEKMVVSEQFGWTDSERWGKQVRPEINLDDKPEGAEWIETYGEQARLLSKDPTGRSIIAHDDWLPHNVRFTNELTLEVVYDWDSLCSGLETIFVGKACIAATGDDIEFFIEAYEEAAGYRFNKLELETIAGTALWMRAFLARWEHSQSTESSGYLRDRLTKDGPSLLNLPGRKE